jgi:hypothetical protein
MSQINRVCIGLPDDLIGSILWVNDEYRTNPLSLEPGGSDIIVEYSNKEVFGYDKIKIPSKYIEKICGSRLLEDFVSENREVQLEVIRDNIRNVYARKYSSETYETEPFEKVWDSITSDLFPWEELQAFDEVTNIEIPPPYTEIPWYLDKI